MLKYLKRAIRQHRLQWAGVLDSTRYRPSKIGDWALWAQSIGSSSVVYSFGVGDNVAWDLAMIEQFGVRVEAFDPTPASIAWVERQQFPATFSFHPWGISNYDGTLDFYPPRKPGSTHFTQAPRSIFQRGIPVQGQVFRLQSIMQRLGHAHIDVLKLDVEGSEFEAIPDMLASGIKVDQLLVEIHYHFRGRSFRQGLGLIERLKASGMQCIYVSPRGFEFAFVRRGLGEDSTCSLPRA